MKKVIITVIVTLLSLVVLAAIFAPEVLSLIAIGFMSDR